MVRHEARGGATVIGVVIGMIAGLITVQGSTGNLPRISFVLSVGALCILVALVGALIPAASAAYRDPLRILRVP